MKNGKIIIKNTTRRHYELVVSIVNFNSSKISPILALLLKALSTISQKFNLLVVVVDNNSTDGSLEAIKRLVLVNQLDSLIVKLSNNYGFAIANNIAYRVALSISKFDYFALLNPDAIPYPPSIEKLLSYLNEDFKTLGVQGVIVTMVNPQIVDNYGFVVDKNGFTYAVCRGMHISCASEVYHPSYLSGAFSIYRNDLLAKEIKHIFDNAFFAYFDDKLLGLKTYAQGLKMMAVPHLSAFHLGSYAFRAMNSSKNLIMNYLSRSSKGFEGLIISELFRTTKYKRMYVYVVPIIVTAFLSSILTKENKYRALIQGLRRLKEWYKKRDYSKLVIDRYLSYNVPLQGLITRNIHLKEVLEYG